MNEPVKNPFDILVEQFRAVVREEIQSALNGNNGQQALLTPEALARQLSVPVTWVYEQSRQGNIPTHRIGCYLRFDVLEVLEAQKKRTP
jgi:hypothetical protein